VHGDGTEAALRLEDRTLHLIINQNTLTNTYYRVGVMGRTGGHKPLAIDAQTSDRGP
jgi:hypothetical protein